MKQQLLIDKSKKIFEILRNNNPNPKIELEYTNPYTLLVAVVLSAQSTDIGVNKATRSLFTTHDSPEKIVKLGIEGLKNYIKTIGLYNNKAKNIIALSSILIEKFNSSVPSTMDELITLPGVGRKSANVILNTIFNIDTMPVDTHVARVSHRLGLTKSKTPQKIEMDLINIIPKTFMNSAHHWLVLHGRYICKAIRPQCSKCSISMCCDFYVNQVSQKAER